MTKTILITGANGQLGQEMQSVLFGTKHNVIATSHRELDVCDKSAIDSFFLQHKIDYIVNCAAYTAVDMAEDDPVNCFNLNAEAVASLAAAAHTYKAKMVHVSTDYVFDGTGCRPYCETDSPCPQSAYGSTKLQGEQLMLAANPSGIVIRTSWLYSPHGHNFVNTMIKLGRERQSLKVVCDQIGTPTYARHLAEAIASIINSGKWLPGIYHYSNEGAISWYDFAKSIHRIACITDCRVEPCMSCDYPTRACRPHYSVLDKSKIKNTYNIEIPYWEDGLTDCINRINELKEI